MGVWAKFEPYQFTYNRNFSGTFTVIFESCSFKLQCMMSCHDSFSTKVPVGTRLIMHFQLGKHLWLLLIKNVFLNGTVLYFKNKNWIQVIDWVDTQRIDIDHRGVQTNNFFLIWAKLLCQLKFSLTVRKQ